MRACSGIDLFHPLSNKVQIDSLEVIEVLAVLKNPPVRRLRLLILWISKPSVFDRLKNFSFSLQLFRLSLSNDRTATVLVHDVFLIDLPL